MIAHACGQDTEIRAREYRLKRMRDALDVAPGGLQAGEVESLGGGCALRFMIEQQI